MQSSEIETNNIVQESPVLGPFFSGGLTVPHLTMLPVFSGFESSCPLEELINRVEEAAVQWHWTESDKAFAIRERLHGEARRCVSDMPVGATSFYDIIKRLKQTFVKTVPPNEALFNFMAFKQSPDMPVEKYISEAASKAKLLSFGACSEEVAKQTREHMLLNMLLSNLHPEILRGVLQKNPKNIVELKEAALIEERAWRVTRFTTNPFLASRDPPPQIFKVEENKTNDKLEKICESLITQMSILTDKVAKLEEVKPRYNKHWKRNIKCFKCGKYGHYAKECLNENKNLN